jgi:DNA (cytosine-5)-methyltransferase 1
VLETRPHRKLGRSKVGPTAFQVIRFAKALKPQWIVVENVVHIAIAEKIFKVAEGNRGLGYHTRVQVLNAADFGVPQNRKRLFVTADLRRLPPIVKGTVGGEPASPS